MNLIFAIYIITTIIGVICFRKLMTPFRWIAVLVWLALVSEIISTIMYDVIGRNAVLGHIYIILTIPAYYFAFRSFLGNKYERIMKTAFFAVFIFSVVNSLFIQSIWVMPTLSIAAISLAVVVCSLLVFLDMLDSPVTDPLIRQGIFWFNVPVFFYHTVLFIVWTTTNYFFNTNDLPGYFQPTVYIMSCLFYACLGIAMVLDYRRKTAG